MLLTMDEPVFTYSILKKLVDNKISVSEVFFLGNPPITFRRLLVMFFVYGPFQFFSYSLQYFWWNLIKNGRVKALFESTGVPCKSLVRSQMNELVSHALLVKPDLILSVFCNCKLPDELLNCARYGGLNLHQGSLPHYKGLMPLFYAQINGEKTVGSTIHLINSSFDSGKIVVSDEINISPDDGYVTTFNRLNNLGSDNLVFVLRFLENNLKYPKTIAQEQQGSYYSIPSIPLVMKYVWMQMCIKTNKLLRKKQCN